MTPESTLSRLLEPISALVELKITWIICWGSRWSWGVVLPSESEKREMGKAMVMFASVSYSSDRLTRETSGLQNVTTTVPSLIRSPWRRRWLVICWSLTNVPLTLLLSSIKNCSPCRKIRAWYRDTWGKASTTSQSGARPTVLDTLVRGYRRDCVLSRSSR